MHLVVVAEETSTKSSATNPIHVTRSMKLLSKEIFLRYDGRRPPAAGFVTYVSKTQPVLMLCHGWEDYSDGYDDYSVSLSKDNGRTWSAEEVRWKSEVTPEGRIRYAEPAAFFDPDKEKLIVLTDKVLYPQDTLDVDREYTLVMDVYDPKTGEWSERRDLTFPGERSPAVSFSFPLKTSHGRLLFPAMRQTVDAAGKTIHYKNGPMPVDEVVTVIGEYRGGEIAWHLGRPLGLAPEISSAASMKMRCSNWPMAASRPYAAGITADFPKNLATNGSAFRTMRARRGPRRAAAGDGWRADRIRLQRFRAVSFDQERTAVLDG